MAKAKLEFDLNNEDDTMAHLRAIKSLDLALVLWETAYNTKKKIHSVIENQDIKDPYEAVDLFFNAFWQNMNERGINLDELIN